PSSPDATTLSSHTSYLFPTYPPPCPPRPPLFPSASLFRSAPQQCEVRDRFEGFGLEGQRDVVEFEPALVLPDQSVLRFDNVSLTDRKSTRLNSSHVSNSYAVVCFQRKNGKRSEH